MCSMMNLCYVKDQSDIKLTRDIVRETKLEFDNEEDTDNWDRFFKEGEAEKLTEAEQVDLVYVRLQRMMLVLCHTDYSIWSSEHNISFLTRILFNKKLLLTINGSICATEDPWAMNKYWIEMSGSKGHDVLVNVYKGVENIR